MSDAVSRIIDRIKNMPHPPRRAVYFKKDVTKRVGDGAIVFKKGEFYQVQEAYGYPRSAMIVQDGIGFYLYDFQNRGTDYMVLIDEDHDDTTSYINYNKSTTSL